MIVNVAPVRYNVNETICSLNFATRCRNVELGQAKRQVFSGNSTSNNGQSTGAGGGLVSGLGSGVGSGSGFGMGSEVDIGAPAVSVNGGFRGLGNGPLVSRSASMTGGSFIATGGGFVATGGGATMGPPHMSPVTSSSPSTSSKSFYPPSSSSSSSSSSSAALAAASAAIAAASVVSPTASHINTSQPSQYPPTNTSSIPLPSPPPPLPPPQRKPTQVIPVHEIRSKNTSAPSNQTLSYTTHISLTTFTIHTFVFILSTSQPHFTILSYLLSLRSYAVPRTPI